MSIGEAEWPVIMEVSGSCGRHLWLQRSVSWFHRTRTSTLMNELMIITCFSTRTCSCRRANYLRMWQLAQVAHMQLFAPVWSALDLVEILANVLPLLSIISWMNVVTLSCTQHRLLWLGRSNDGEWLWCRRIVGTLRGGMMFAEALCASLDP